MHATLGALPPNPISCAHGSTRARCSRHRSVSTAVTGGLAVRWKNGRGVDECTGSCGLQHAAIRTISRGASAARTASRTARGNVPTACLPPESCKATPTSILLKSSGVCCWVQVRRELRVLCCCGRRDTRVCVRACPRHGTSPPKHLATQARRHPSTSPPKHVANQAPRHAWLQLGKPDASIQVGLTASSVHAYTYIHAHMHTCTHALIQYMHEGSRAFTLMCNRGGVVRAQNIR
eukprot:365580-Chlamydomonas_euryale.AAC.2